MKRIEMHITNKRNPYNRAKYTNERRQYVCPICRSVINPWKDFKNHSYRKEWDISGLCQDCQDITFQDSNFDEEEEY